MEIKLVQTENDYNFKQFKLCNDNNDTISSFDVEISKETALISYVTEETYRNQGYASKGLKLLTEELFNDDCILFLELINLSGDYSRKVAENAGFISPSNTMDYYVLVSPRAEGILENKLSSLDESSPKYKRYKKLLEKVQIMIKRESITRQKLHDKLNQLLERLELEESEEHKKYLESEINHLKKVIETSDLNKEQEKSTF